MNDREFLARRFEDVFAAPCDESAPIVGRSPSAAAPFGDPERLRPLELTHLD